MGGRGSRGDSLSHNHREHTMILMQGKMGVQTDLGSDGRSDFGGDGAYGGTGTVLGDGGGEDEGDGGEEGSVESDAHHVDCVGVGWVKVEVEVVRRRGGDCWLVDRIVDEGVAAELEKTDIDRRGFIYPNHHRKSEGNHSEDNQSIFSYFSYSMMHSQDIHRLCRSVSSMLRSPLPTIHAMPETLRRTT